MIQDEEGARLCGVNPAAIRSLVFTLSGVLAALVAVTRSMTAPVTVNAGIDFTILALIVAVVGGLGSVSGAFLAGVLLGIVNTVSSYYIGSYVTTIVLLGAAAVTIVLRPVGPARERGHDRRSQHRADAATRRRRDGAPSMLRRSRPIVVTAARPRPGPAALRRLPHDDGRGHTGLLFAAYTIGFNVIFGSTGQLFLCVGALAGLGGYTSAILSDRVGMPMLARAWSLATAIAAVVGGHAQLDRGQPLARRDLHRDRHPGLLAGVPEPPARPPRPHRRRDRAGRRRRRRHVPRRARPAVLRVPRPRRSPISWSIRLLQRSHIGWAFRALRDDEIAAELAGVDVKRYRVFAGTVGAAMLGLAGALYAHSEGFISPSTFGVRQRRRARARDARLRRHRQPARAGGRRGRVHDPRRVAGVVHEYRLMIYGAVIIVLFLGFRRGVVPAVERVLATARRRRSSPQGDLGRV